MKTIKDHILLSLFFLLFHLAVCGQTPAKTQMRFPAIKEGFRMATGGFSDMRSQFLRYHKKSFKDRSLVQTFTLSYTKILPYEGHERKGISLETGALFTFQDMLLNLHFHPSIGLSAGNESWYQQKTGNYITVLTGATAGFGINIWRFETNVDVGLMGYGGDIGYGGEISFAYIFSNSMSFWPYRRVKQ